MFSKIFVSFLVLATVKEIIGIEYCNNGKYKIPSLGLGTFTVTNEKELTDALNEALKLGYRHIDTATFYQNEHIIGKVLKEWISTGKLRREDLFITTKLAFTDMFPENVENAIDTSLEKLQLDYLDLWLIHFPVAIKFNGTEISAVPTDFLSVWKKMEDQVDAGKTRTIGLSNFNISQIQRVQKIARIPPVNLQIETNLYFQQRELRDFAKRNNITVVAYSPLGAPGVNKYLQETLNIQVKLPNILKDEIVTTIGKKHNKSNAQIGLKFLLQSDLVVIPKSTNPKRLKENIDIFDFTLDEDDMKKLESLDKGKKAKIFLFEFVKGLLDHPEYPFYENLPEKS